MTVGASIRTEALPSGIRLVSEPMADVHSVAVGFWVGTGSRDEVPELAGASHFLEHLLFKGTAERSAAAIAEELDAVGGDCNAFTTKEYTAFYIRLLAEHLPLGLDILSEIMRDPALRPGDVDAERRVILDEILMHADEPSDLVWERWQAALFPSHALGQDTLGSASSVKAIGADEIRRFFGHHYRPGNMVVSVAGDCRHEHLAEAVESRFGGLSGGEAPSRRPPEAPVDPLVVVRRPTEQAHLVLGARSVSRFDEDRWALAVLNHVLGGGLSSRLFQKIREERGLAYSVWSDRVAYHDTGSVAVSAGTAPDNVAEVLRIVTDELGLLAAHGITERELAIAKGNLRSDALLACEDSGARMSRVGTSLLLQGEVPTVEDQLGRIEAVGLDDVLRVAGRLAAAPRVLAAVGPFDPDDFDPDALGLNAREEAGTE
ncbi:MAG TPA: pitrilysin family protein [Acidimicrobiales bacterium]|nr:pitrilysin family protein [Acidimicrobiales bacterium]